MSSRTSSCIRIDATANSEATADAAPEAQKDPDTQNASGVVYELGDDGVAKRKKSWYSQFNTEIMRWAYQADRKPGDITIKSRDGEVSALVEATEDGYIILYEANHEEVQRQYELYRQRSSLNGHSYRASLVDRGVHRNSESGENGRVQKGFNRDYRENSNTQHDIGNDHKSLRSGDKKTSEGRNGKKYKPSPGVTLSRKDTKYFQALESGDMETVRRLVEEAADDVGYESLMYHGAKNGGGFTTFKDWSFFTRKLMLNSLCNTERNMYKKTDDILKT